MLNGIKIKDCGFITSCEEFTQFLRDFDSLAANNDGLKPENINGSGLTPDNASQDALNRRNSNAITVLSYNTFPLIDLENEIDGITGSLAALCAYSSKAACTVFCGVHTVVAGLKQISIAVCHNGSVIDIVDRTQNIDGTFYMPSTKIKIFSTGKINIAALVDTDAAIEKNWIKTVPHCDMILSILNNGDYLKDAAAAAQKYSKPFLCVKTDGVFWYDGENADE